MEFLRHPQSGLRWLPLLRQGRSGTRSPAFHQTSSPRENGARLPARFRDPERAQVHTTSGFSYFRPRSFLIFSTKRVPSSLLPPCIGSCVFRSPSFTVRWPLPPL